jgi:hypothetical protein
MKQNLFLFRRRPGVSSFSIWMFPNDPYSSSPRTYSTKEIVSYKRLQICERHIPTNKHLVVVNHHMARICDRNSFMKVEVGRPSHNAKLRHSTPCAPRILSQRQKGRRPPQTRENVAPERFPSIESSWKIHPCDQNHKWGDLDGAMQR